MASFELFGTDTIGVRRTLSSLAWPTERHERTIGDEFIFCLPDDSCKFFTYSFFYFYFLLIIVHCRAHPQRYRSC